MQAVRRATSRSSLTFSSLRLALVLAIVPGHPPLADPIPEEIVYQSGGLRIFRTTSRHGMPAMVLTNLDEDGNALAGPGLAGDEGHQAAGPCGAGPAAPGTPPPSSAGPPRPTETRPPGGVRVLVQGGGEAAPVGERDVEIQSDAAGGTTVIVNINAPAAPEKETLLVPAFSYPLVAYGGLVGAFHYPDRLPFLGYGPSNATPVFFGGLGLSSTDRYARAACGVSASGPGCAVGSRTPGP